MENERFLNDNAANGHTERTDELVHALSLGLTGDAVFETPAVAVANTDEQNQIPKDEVSLAGKPNNENDVNDQPDALMYVPKIPRTDTKQEAEDAIRLYNERGGLTPLEIAVCLFERTGYAGCNSKKILNTIKAKAKRIESALYKARNKKRLTVEAPNHDACYLSELKDVVLSSKNGFAPDTPVKVEFMPSMTDGPIDSFIVTRL